MNLVDIAKELGTEEQCLNYLESLRWPNGVRCVKCDSAKVTKFTTKESTRTRVSKKTGEAKEVRVPARHLYQCKDCKYQFSATAGTVFQDTHLPLQKWFFAVSLMLDARKGLSARQMQRHIASNGKTGSYETAWFLCHRIREAMTQNTDKWLTGEVEVDETYLGGRFDKRRKRQRYDKYPVMGLLQRARDGKCSKVQTLKVNDVSKKRANDEIRARVNPLSTIYSDESSIYADVWKKVQKHETVVHVQKEWVRGTVSTNGIEGFWSLFERGLVGQYHQLSWKHLERYLSEHSFRFNSRDEKNLFRTVVTRLLVRQALPYVKLTAESSEPDAELRMRRKPS